MYENCMLILGLEGVKLHGSTGEQILSLSVKNDGFWASDLYECLCRGAVNPIQLQCTFLWNEKNLTFMRNIGSITSHYSHSLFGRCLKGEREGIWAWKCTWWIREAIHASSVPGFSFPFKCLPGHRRWLRLSLREIRPEWKIKFVIQVRHVPVML